MSSISATALVFSPSYFHFFFPMLFFIRCPNLRAIFRRAIFSSDFTPHRCSELNIKSNFQSKESLPSAIMWSRTPQYPSIVVGMIPWLHMPSYSPISPPPFSVSTPYPSIPLARLEPHLASVSRISSLLWTCQMFS